MIGFGLLHHPGMLPSLAAAVALVTMHLIGSARRHHPPDSPRMATGFLVPHRKLARTLSYRLWRNKRRRLAGLSRPIARLFSVRPLSRMLDLIAFWEAHGRLPRFPRTGYLNDYLYLLKGCEDNLELRRRTTDKEFAKAYIAEKCGADCPVPTLAVLSDPAEIDTFRFPPKSVVKATHMSGVIYLCGETQPSQGDRDRMKGWFDIDYSLISNEINYRGLAPKIIVEPFLTFNGQQSWDLRMFMFGGELRMIEVVSSRYGNPVIDFFDQEWRHLTGWRKNNCGHSNPPPPKPARLSAMVAAARAIAADFSFVRVDFYTDFATRFHIGEITHISGNCRDQITPPEADRYYVTGFPG